MSEKNEEMELLSHKYFQQITFSYSPGTLGAKFFNELKENKKLMGIKCPKCAKVYVPPRPVCPECFEETTEWAEVGPKGTVIGCTAVNISFPDPLSGAIRPTPYGYGLIQLDGCTGNFMHFLEESDYNKLKPGMRVEAVFAEKREGSMTDLLPFKIIEE